MSLLLILAAGVLAEATPERATPDRPASDRPASERADAAVITGTRDLRGEALLDEEIVVEGEKPGYKVDVVQVGAFRNRSLLETPMTVEVINRKLLDDQGAQGLADALRNTPGITQQTTSPFNTNTFNSRGLSIDALTNYRLNGGLPIINYAPMPLEDKQRVELLQGVAALYYGFASPSGILNIVTKRAGSTPVTTIYGNVDSNGTAGGGFDVARTFGQNGEVGVRLNGYAARLDGQAKGVTGDRKLISGAFDWKPTAALSLRADIEYYTRRGEEQGGITLPSAVNGTITLPQVPSPGNRYSPEGAEFNTSGFNAALRADLVIAPDWTVRAEGGQAEARRDRMQVRLGSIDLATGNGTLTITETPGQYWRNRYARLELAGKVTTGPISHELLFGVARTDQYRADQLSIRYKSLAQNLYDPVSLDAATLVAGATSTTAGNRVHDTGVYAMDIATLTPWAQVIGGARYVDYRVTDSDGNYAVHTVTPTGALVLRPSARSSLYLSYLQGLESAGVAPDDAVNAGEVLKPARSRQWEAGGRIEVLGATASLAWFNIDRALAYENSAGVYVVNGRARHRGVEGSIQGSLGRTIELALSSQYLDAVQARTGTAAQDGKRVVNAPRWSGSAFLQYRPAFAPAFAVNAGAYYIGARYADALNLARLPGYATLSLGGSYRWTLADRHTVTFRLNADNLADKRYWATGGTTLYPGDGRTVRASIAVEL